MGFNKRFIRKDMIIDSIDSLLYISNLVNADALILDNWSNNFFKNFNFKWKSYNEIREGIINDHKFESNNNMIKHINYKNLFNLSNILLNLKSNPSWLDIHLASDVLKEKNIEFNIHDDISGVFDSIVEYTIESIDKYYENT